MAKKNTDKFEIFNRAEAKKAIEDCLRKKYGKVESEWYLPINQLLNNMEIQSQCVAYIRENGIMTKDGKKNELLATISSLEGMILKYSNDMGLTVKSSARVAEMKKGKTQDADLLQALIAE